MPTSGWFSRSCTTIGIDFGLRLYRISLACVTSLYFTEWKKEKKEEGKKRERGKRKKERRKEGKRVLINAHTASQGESPAAGEAPEGGRGRSERLKKILHNLSDFWLHNLSNFDQKYVPMATIENQTRTLSKGQNVTVLFIYVSLIFSLLPPL